MIPQTDNRPNPGREGQLCGYPQHMDARRDPNKLGSITLTGLRAVGFHGVLDSERATGQEFVVDLTLALEFPSNDELVETVDYSKVAEAVVGIIAGEPVNLIETLAERIADQLLADHRVNSVQVTVHKPNAPMNTEFTDVAVTIMRSNDV